MFFFRGTSPHHQTNRSEQIQCAPHVKYIVNIYYCKEYCQLFTSPCDVAELNMSFSLHLTTQVVINISVA